MKNYFFSYTDWGTCYTVMAESKKEAIDIVFNHIEKQDQYTTHYKNKKLMLEKYDIEEYAPGQVIETEYS